MSKKNWRILIWPLQRQTAKPPNFPAIQYYLLQWICVIIMACVIPLFYLQVGQTVLYLACGLNHLEIVKVLLEYGAQVNKPNNVSEFNLLNK